MASLLKTFMAFEVIEIVRFSASYDNSSSLTACDVLHWPVKRVSSILKLATFINDSYASYENLLVLAETGLDDLELEILTANAVRYNHVAFLLPMSAHIAFERSVLNQSLLWCSTYFQDEVYISIPFSYTDCRKRKFLELSDASSVSLIPIGNEEFRIGCSHRYFRHGCSEITVLEEYVRTHLNSSLKRSKEKSFQETLQGLQNRETFAVFSVVMPEQTRSSLYDLTYPIIVAHFTFIYPSFTELEGTIELITLFPTYVTLCIVASLVAFSAFYSFTCKDVTVIPLIVAAPSVPFQFTRSTNRFFISSFLVFSFMICNAYKSLLLSKFNIPPVLSLDTFDHLINALQKDQVKMCYFDSYSKDRVIKVLNGTPDEQDFINRLSRYFYRAIIVRKQEECVERHAVFFGIPDFMKSLIPYPISSGKENVQTILLAFPTTPSLPYRKIINTLILRCTESNICSRSFRVEHKSVSYREKRGIVKTGERILLRDDFTAVAYCFILLLGVSVLIAGLEFLHSKCKLILFLNWYHALVYKIN